MEKSGHWDKAIYLDDALYSLVTQTNKLARTAATLPRKHAEQIFSISIAGPLLGIVSEQDYGLALAAFRRLWDRRRNPRI